MVETVIKWDFEINLEHIALIKIVTLVWEQTDVQQLITEYDFDTTGDVCKLDKKWFDIENLVLQKVTKLLMPSPLKCKALNFTKVIGKQIFQWLEFNEVRRKLISKDYRKKLRLVWTPYGTVDLDKTAKILVNDEHLEVTRRYAISCVYCVLHRFRDLNNIISHSNYNNDLCTVLSEANVIVTPFEIALYVYFGRKSLECDYFNCGHGFKSVFTQLALTGNIAGILSFLRYSNFDSDMFISVLNRLLSKYSLIEPGKSFPPKYIADVLVFLLSKIDPIEQNNILISSASSVLHCFLEWPWQKYFQSTAQKVYQFLSVNKFLGLLEAIREKGKQNHDGCDFQNLFVEFWLNSPRSLREPLFDVFINISTVFFELFPVNDGRSMKVLMVDVSASVKELFLFSDTGLNTYKQLILMEKWETLKFLIKESIYSTRTAIKLHKMCIKYFRRTKCNVNKESKIEFLTLLTDHMSDLRAKQYDFHVKNEIIRKGRI